MKKVNPTARIAALTASVGIFILLSGLLAPQLAQAADGTWNGASGATWNTSAVNWSGLSGTPWDSSNGSGNTAIFSSGANATVSGGSNVYVNKITFNTNTSLLYTSPPEAVVTLAGANATINAATGTTSTIKTVLAGSNGLIKTGGGTVILEPGDGFWANTISGPITINGGQLTSIRATSLGDGAGAITINSGGTLSVDWTTVTRTGLVTVNGGTLTTQGGTPELINNGDGFLLQNGGALNTRLAGSGGLTVNGARSYLYSANTYTGATVINAGGDLALAYGGDLPTTTALNLSGVLLANNKNHTVGGLTGASTGLYYGDAAGTFTVNKVSGTDTYGGIIQNVGTFIKDGAGTLSLTHPDNNTTFPNALTVNNGVLELGGAGRLAAGSYSGAISLSTNSSVLQIATSANQTLGGAISGTGALTKSGTGTLTVSGSNSYSGGTTVSSGTLNASAANALGNAAGAITVNTNGTLNVNANITRTGTVTMNGGELGTGNGSTLTNNGDGFVLTGGYAAAALVLAGSGGLTVSSPDARLWVQATYTGATTVNSGTLNICGAGGISTNSALSIASGANVNLTSYYAPDNINRTIGGLTGAGALNGNGGTVTVNKTSGSDTFSGVISGAQGLIKAGAGDLVLAGANTYAGITTVSTGRLAVTNNNALGSTAGGTTVNNGAQLYLNGVTVGNEALTLSGTGLASGSSIAGALRSVGANTWGGTVTLAADSMFFAGSGASLTLDVASGNAVDLGAYTLTFDGAGTNRVNDGISGTGGLTKIGSGNTTLAAANTFTGKTTVNLGTLTLASGASLASTEINLGTTNRGTLNASALAGGGMTIGSGQTLAGYGTMVGNTTIASGATLAPGNSPGVLGITGNLTLNSGSTSIFEVAGLGAAGATNGFDQVNASGILAYGGLLKLDISGFYDNAGGAFSNHLFNFGSETGAFTSVQYRLNGGSYADLNYYAANNTWQMWDNNGGAANGYVGVNLDTGVLTVVPEPSTCALYGIGALALVIAVRRRQTS